MKKTLLTILCLFSKVIFSAELPEHGVRWLVQTNYHPKGNNKAVELPPNKFIEICSSAALQFYVEQGINKLFKIEVKEVFIKAQWLHGYKNNRAIAADKLDKLLKKMVEQDKKIHDLETKEEQE